MVVCGDERACAQRLVGGFWRTKNIPQRDLLTTRQCGGAVASEQRTAVIIGDQCQLGNRDSSEKWRSNRHCAAPVQQLCAQWQRP